jgi:3'-phosphoadenosine 5'-phosphosulfate sulfotransferase (PAPS reductase)/FAD synthetase
MAKHTKQELYQWQALPLNIKVRMTAERIRNWVNEFGEDGVYLSFSAGKDSTVLGHIIREVCGYKNIPFVFVDVPTQYPELKQFALTFDNLEILKSKISFAEVCSKYGFPLFSKEISECVAVSRKYIRILTDKQKNRDSVCLSHSRIDRNRQESIQRKQNICGFKDGEYP